MSMLDQARAKLGAGKPSTPPAVMPEKAGATNGGSSFFSQAFGAAEKAGVAVKAAAVESELAAAIRKLNETHFVAPEGGKVAVWHEGYDFGTKQRILVPMTVTDFKALHVNPTFTIQQEGRSPTKVSLGAAWFLSPNRREYKLGMYLLPNGETPEGVYNLFRGFGVDPKEGDCSGALDFILTIICAGSEANYRYLIRWLAWCVQNPDRQAEVAVVLQGLKGTGKGTLGRWMLTIFASHGLHILHSRHLIGNFNAHLRSTLFGFVDEAFFAGDKAAEGVLKGIITEPTILIEAKGFNAVAVRNMLKILMATNSRWAVPASADERRWFLLEVSPLRRGDSAYFRKLKEHMDNGGLVALMHYFQTLDLTDFDIRAVPNTAALEQQKILSMGAFHSWLFNKLFDGDWEVKTPRDGFVREFGEYAKEKYLRYEQTDNRTVGTELRKIFPSIEDKRETQPPRCRLWILPELEEARQQFADHFGLEHVQWPKAEGEATEAPSKVETMLATGELDFDTD